MNKFEQLESSRPELVVKYVNSISHHFKGFIHNNVVYLSNELRGPECYQCLQEEVAHFDLTVGDIVAGETLDDQKQENLARSKAMQRSVSLEGLIDCANRHITDADELAEYFEVTTEYLKLALQNYVDKKGVAFDFNNYHFDLTHGFHITRLSRSSR